MFQITKEQVWKGLSKSLQMMQYSNDAIDVIFNIQYAVLCNI